MAKKTYGVEITAITSSFKNKMNEIKTLTENSVKKVKKKLKSMSEDFATGYNIDVKADTKALENLKQGLQKMMPDIPFEFDKNGNLTIAEKDLKKFQNELGFLGKEGRQQFSDMQGAVKGLTQDLNAVKDNKVMQLGQKAKSVSVRFQELKQKIKSAFSQGATNSIKKLKDGMKNVGKSSDNLASKIKKMAGNVTKQFKKFALAIVGVRTAFFAMRKAVSSYLAYDEQLNEQLNDTWSALGAQLAPVIEFVINLFSKAVAYVNAFVQALTGINMVARANAKALKQQSKASASANKSLAGIDEINNIDSDSGSSGDIKQIEMPEINAGNMEALIERLKSLFATIFDPIKQAWDNTGGLVIQSAKDMILSLKDTISAIGGSLAEVWTNGTGQEIVEGLLKQWRLVFDVIKNVSNAFKNAWKNDGNGTKIIQGIADIFKTIQDFSNSIFESLKQWTMSESFQNALKVVIQIVKDMVERIKDIAKWIVDIYKEYLKPIVDKVLLLISDIIEMIGEIWKVVKPVVDKVIDILKKVLEPVIKTLSKVIGGIIDIVRDIVKIITNSLKGNWDKVFNGMKNIVKTVINGIIGFFNLWIKGLNAFLKPVRKLIVSIAKAFGSKVSLDDVKIPTIPKLDVGTNYVPEDQLAYIHKGEAVVPKKFNSAEYFDRGTNNNDVKELLVETNRLLGKIEEKDNNTYLDGKEIGKSTVDYIRKQSRILGRSVV